MEPLSAGASIIAVVSLTFQVVEGISKLRDFFESIQNAPSEIRTILKDLAQLSAVVGSIQVDERRCNDVLSVCMDKINQLNHIISDLELPLVPTSRKRLQWSAIKAARKSATLKKFRDSLEETKSTLVLGLLAKSLSVNLANRSDLNLIQAQILDHHNEARTNSSRIAAKQDHQLQEGKLMVEKLAALHLEHTSQLVSTKSEVLGVRGHLAELSAEINRMATAITNPFIRRGFKTTVKAAVESQLKKVEDELDTVRQRHAERPVQSTSSNDQESVTIRCDEYNEIDDDWNEERSEYTNLRRAASKRRRIRYPANDVVVIYRFFFGQVHIRTTTYHLTVDHSLYARPAVDNNLLELETSFIYHPSQRLLRFGLLSGLSGTFSRSTRGWKHQIRTFRAVPDDALVFEFCRTRNIDGVRSLLSRGDASPWDVNSQGFTPLHMAAASSSHEICHLLLNMGADRNALTYNIDDYYSWPLSVFSIACIRLYPDGFGGCPYELDHSRHIDTLRMFIDDWDLDEERHRPMVSLAEIFLGLELRDELHERTERYKAFDWALRKVGSDLRDGTLIKLVARLYRDLAIYPFPPTLLMSVMDFTGVDLDAVTVNGGYTALLYTMDEPYYDGMTKKARILAEAGANLHYVGHDESWLLGMQTPTSIAMRCSSTFYQWRELLLDLGHDLDSFVREELEQCPLVDDGWDQDSLVTLFKYEFRYVDPQIDYGWSEICWNCGRVMFARREISWCETLRRIKLGKYPEAQNLESFFEADGVAGSDSDPFSDNPAMEASEHRNQTPACTGTGDYPSALDESDLSDSEDQYHYQYDRRFQIVCDWCLAEAEDVSTEEEIDADFTPHIPGSFES